MSNNPDQFPEVCRNCREEETDCECDEFQPRDEQWAEEMRENAALEKAEAARYERD